MEKRRHLNTYLVHLCDLLALLVDDEHLVGRGGFEDAELGAWEARAGRVDGA